MNLTMNMDFVPYQPYLENNTYYKNYKPQIDDPLYGIVWEVYQVEQFNAQKSFAFPDISADFMVFYSNNKVECYLMGGTKDLKVMTDLAFFKGVHTIFGVRFSTSKQGNLFKSIRSIGGEIVPGIDALHNGETTIRAFEEVHTFEERWQLIKSYLIRQLNGHYKIDPLIQYVSTYVINNRGKVLIKDLEQLTGYSERYLRKKVTDGLGVSIKSFCHITQFQWSYHFASQVDEDLNLSELAHRSGFYDQSHMNMVYKKLTGLLPKKAIVLYK